MANYAWRGISGAFGTAGDWIDTSTGANPAPTPPGTGDVATFSGGGNSVSGNGSVETLAIQPATSIAGWNFSGALTAQSTIVTGNAYFSTGARLTLTGVADGTGTLPYTGNLNAYVLLVGATLDSSGGDLNVGSDFGPQDGDNIGNSLQVTAGSTATAQALAIGLGEFGSVQVTGAGSTLTTVTTLPDTNAGLLLVGGQETIGGVETTGGDGALAVNSGGAVTVADGLIDGEDGGGDILVGTGGTMTVDNGFSTIGNIAGSFGLLTVDSGGTFTLAGGQLAVGNQAGANGSVTVSAGGSFIATETPNTVSYILEIGNHAASGGLAAGTGTVTVTGQGALLDLGQNALSVGYYGTGTLNVMSGGVVKTVSTNSTGSNASPTSLSSLAVGRYGSGTVNIDGAGSVISATGGLYDGRASGGDGVINVTNGGVLDQFFDQYGLGGIGIGAGDTLSGQQASGGTGTLNVNTSGAVFGAGSLTVGNNGCTGTVALDTDGTISVGGQIAIGTGGTYGNGDGTVTISGGASLRTAGPHATGSAGIAIANQVSTTGGVTVTGGGSVLDAGGDRISVGTRGVGSLVVEGGASASAGSTLYTDAAAEAGFSVATNATGSGTVVIDGTGTSLAVDGAITLAGGLTAAGGSGSLSITNGAAASATGLVLWAGGTVSADSASTLELGSGTAAAGGVAIQSGAALTAHGGAIIAAVSNAGTLSNDGALTVSGGITGSGMLSLLAGSTTTASGGVDGGSVGFAAATGTLTLGEFTGAETVSAMQVGDVIDLLGINDAAVVGSDVRAGTGDLAFTSLGGLALELTSDGRGGTDVTVGVACYCPGTLIMTDRGEQPVEALAIGDAVTTASGQRRPIKWIGRRSYTGRELAGRKHLLPIRIAAGALGDGLPHRDLRISPLHAMLLDGVLVPAWLLVNGTSIIQESGCRRVDYIHIELETHDAIWAEGAASETFLDDDSRFMFHNASEHAALYPDDVAVSQTYCAPRVEDGYQLEAIRQRLAGVAGEMTATA